MITLATILIIFGIFSTYRIYKACKKKNIDFSPLDGSLVDYIGFIVGIATSIVTLVISCLLFLP